MFVFRELRAGKTSFVSSGVVVNQKEQLGFHRALRYVIVTPPQSNSKKSAKEKPMKNTISRALTTTRVLELEYKQPSGSHQSEIGSDPSMLMEELGDRPLIDELAVFANAIWA